MFGGGRVAAPKSAWWEALSKDEQTAWLRQKAIDGFSASRIAEMICATRNSVIGLCHRAKPKITTHASSAHRSTGAGRAWMPKARKPARLPKAKTNHLSGKSTMTAVEDPPEGNGNFVDHEPVAPTEPKRTLATVEHGECHFPMFTDAMLKETTTPSALPYCGAKAVDGGDYCEFHRRRMYVAASPLPPGTKPLS